MFIFMFLIQRALQRLTALHDTIKNRVAAVSWICACAGKWAHASKEEAEAKKAEGAPFCYRMRVPENKDIVIDDLVRGTVSFNTSSVGDFVVMRSNGIPVYVRPCP